MSKEFIRSVACVLLAAIAVTTFASCANNSADTGKTANVTEATSETEKKWLDNLPEDINLEGREIRLITNDQESFESVEEAIDVVDTAVYNRNVKIEERLNYKLAPQFYTEWGEAATQIRNSVTAGSDDYDVYGGYSYWSIALATDGYMRNLTNMEYLDFDQPYWGKKFIDAMAYRDYIYWATGDIVLNYTDGIYATFVNHDKWKTYFPDTDLYQLVLDGKWTLEKLTEHAVAAYSDLNGNGQVDADDFVGFVYSLEDCIDGMAMAAGVKFTEFDADGVPYIVITSTGLDRAVRFTELLTNLCQSSGAFQATADDCKTVFEMFGNLHAMFAIGRIKHGVTYLRDMVEDFAIIPAPKLDESQATYLTTLHDGTTILGIPKTVGDEVADYVCMVLEALAAESSRALTPVYLDVALKNKYTRDENSAAMIDLIRENIVSDFGFQYTATGFNNFFRQRTKDGVGVATTIAKLQKSWTKSLENILKQLEDNAM
ncbi:MAG: hypothetical protein GX067_04775 [Clostridiales bacterium]|jgi:hypothetical protein|nr:hypothetical protein [Clostridiales bacterium]